MPGGIVSTWVPASGISGGPLLVPYMGTWAEIGVVSRAVNVDQCGNIPAAFARVTSAYDYIVSVGRLELSDVVSVGVGRPIDRGRELGELPLGVRTRCLSQLQP